MKAEQLLTGVLDMMDQNLGPDEKTSGMATLATI